MEIQQLRYVIAVADSGNFTRASERCSVTQPSLSQQIINLEKELGHKLFHRLGRRAVMTEAGSVFLDRARRIVQEVDDSVRELKDGMQFEREILVGAIPTLAPHLLPPILALAKKLYPQLVIRLKEDFRDDLVRGVVEGELDLAIVAMPVKDHRIAIETLFLEPLLLVLGKQHPLATRPKVRVDDLIAESFIMMGSGSTIAIEIQRFCGNHQFEPKISYHCAQVATVKALVSLGLGVSILPQVTLSPEDRTSLICRSLTDHNPTREIAVIRHLQRYQSRGSEQFLTLLREHTRGRNEK